MTKATTSPYRRTNAKDPRGYGTWAFQRSTTRDAYWGDLYGEPTFYPGTTFTEARAQARRDHADAEYTACMG